MNTITRSAEKPRTRLAPFLALWAMAGFALAQPVDLYCDVEGSSYFEHLKKTHPSAGTLVFRIDAAAKQVKQAAGLFADDPVRVTSWTEVALELEQPSTAIGAPFGVNGYRITRIDRATGRFAVEHEFRNDKTGKVLSQRELEQAHQQSGGIELFRPTAGLALVGRCAVKEKLF